MEILANSKHLSETLETIRQKFGDVSEDIILLEILVKISEIASLNRMQVQSIEATTFCNIYSLLFAESGSGKDKPIRFIDQELIGTYKNTFKNKSNEYYNRVMREIEEVAEEKHSGSKSMKEQYIRDNSPRYLTTEIGNGTMEGLIDYRLALQHAGFGGTFIMISELADYITSQNNSRMEFLTLIQEIYDSGDSLGKVIKGNKRVDSVKSVPSTIHFHTSPHGLLEGYGSNKLKQFLNRGLARRSFVCFVESVKSKDTDDVDTAYLKYLEAKKTIDLTTIKNYFTDIALTEIYGNKFVYSESADKLLFEYMFQNRKLSESKYGLSEEAVRAEVRNRHWKMLKLSGLIALFERPNDRLVTDIDVQTAIKITDHYGSHFLKFYQAKEVDSTQKLYNFFVTNKGKYFTSMELRKEKFVSEREFSNWIKTAIPELQNYALSEGNQIVVKDLGNGGKKYRFDNQEELVKKQNLAIINSLGIQNETLKQIFDNNSQTN